MSEDSIIAIVAIGSLFGGPMIWLIIDSIASNWRKVQIAEQNALLKREMIDRGFSADEIVRVVGAGPGDKMAGKKSRQPASADA